MTAAEVLDGLLAMDPLDERSQARARERLASLTKPLGSLGRLEALVVQIAGIQSRPIPSVDHPAALLFAGDHGVSRDQVSRYDPEVTEQMAASIAMGGAVSSVLARHQSVPLTLVDVGMFRRPRHPGIAARAVRPGTGNIRREPAMSHGECRAAAAIGAESALSLMAGGTDLLALGEMGIGNTAATAALAAVLLDLPARQTVGRGTGIDEAGYQRKRAAVEAAIARHQAAGGDFSPWGLLAGLGGVEIAALAGAVMAAARHRVPVLLDGVTTAAAAAWAERLAPGVRQYCVAAHRSPEPAHAALLDFLGLEPLVDWGLRLGEGSGALLLLPILRQAVAAMRETATFQDARVANPHPPAPAPTPEPGEPAPVAPDFSDPERAAVYKVMAARRDIRSFLPDPVDGDALARILAAAHQGPSVGLMQPWNFIVIHDLAVRAQLQALAEAERQRAADNYEGLRRDHYLRLKVEGLLDAPCTICVTSDPTRGGTVLGRSTIPETALMSTACAIENLWLAARAEGLGVGWVSFYRPQDVRALLNIPDSVDPVALLCLGYTAHFPDRPLLERVDWERRRPLSAAVYQDRWGAAWSGPHA